MSGASVSLGKRIAGATDLSSVVRSMKALAASSITQYERAVESLQDYYRTVELGLSVCLRTAVAADSAALESSSMARSTPKAMTRGAVIFGSDQGLVGRFNESMMAMVERSLEALPGKTTRVWAVGDRMQELVTAAGLPSAAPLSIPNSVDAIAGFVDQLLIDVLKSRAQDHALEIYLFHHQPLVAAGYQPVVKRLLPLDALWQKQVAALAWPTNALPEVIGGALASIDELVREYLFVLLFQACAQSLASENASRLAAMQRADDNIKQVLDQLGRKFRRLRQESIDEELFEVVSGYEALSQEGDAH